MDGLQRLSLSFARLRRAGPGQGFARLRRARLGQGFARLRRATRQAGMELR